jgi:hypothetical protein
MIRYLGTEDDVINPKDAIADWTADNKNFTHLSNESHLKLVEEQGLGHHVSPGEKEMMKKFFHDPEYITQIHP